MIRTNREEHPIVVLRLWQSGSLLGTGRQGAVFWRFSDLRRRTLLGGRSRRLRQLAHPGAGRSRCRRGWSGCCVRGCGTALKQPIPLTRTTRAAQHFCCALLGLRCLMVLRPPKQLMREQQHQHRETMPHSRQGRLYRQTWRIYRSKPLRGHVQMLSRGRFQTFRQ